MPRRFPLSPWLLVAITVSVAGSTAALVAVRWLVPVSVLTAHNDAAGSYLQTLGTIYAVLLAFVVFVVWSQYNDARAAVEREANELTDLHRTVHGFPQPRRGQVRARLREYVVLVAEEEWPLMAQRRHDPRADSVLDEVWRVLEALEPASPREESLYGEALARFNDLSDSRTHRLHTARLRLPPTMWALLLVGAGLTVASMALFGVPSVWAHGLMTAALAGLICFVLYVVLDLDNPFWGDWRITPEPLLAAIPPASEADAAAARAEAAPPSAA